MKKILVSILVVILTLSSTVFTAFAAPSGALTSSVLIDESGTKFTVNLSIKNNPGFIAISTLAEYDSTVLRLVDVENGEIFDNIFISSQSLSVNPYKVMYMEATSKTDITTNGLLTTYTFEVLDTANIGKTKINFKVDESVTAQNGVAEISECTVNIKVNNITETSDKNQSSSNKNQEITLDTPTENQTIEILKPQENVNSKNQSSDFKPQNNISFDNNEDSDNSVNTTIIFTAIISILLIGGLLTVLAVVLKKKDNDK